MGPEQQVLSPRLHLYSRFHSRFLLNDRDILVYLPPDYHEAPVHHYPVLYMQDGQNLFNNNSLEQSNGNANTWKADEMADAAVFRGESEPVLIVGVTASNERRMTEYTPTADWKLGGGEAHKYGKLLVEELLPFIAAEYRVKPGPANTGLGGSSLGALAALYLGLQYPKIFGKLAVLSPSVWWNHRAILALVAESHPAMLNPRPRIWLDVGTGEGERAVADTNLLEARLRANGWRPGSDLRYERVPGGTHDEASWARRFPLMLRFLFPGP